MSQVRVAAPATKLLVLIAPTLMAIAQVWSLMQLPPFWRQLPDPIYQYLLNGVAITSGVTPGHTDHPGTSMQWLMGLIQWVSFHIAGRSEDFAADVVGNPEWYLTIDAYVLIFLQLIAFVYASWRLARYVGVKAVFVFQAMVLAAVPVFLFTIYPVPENLVWLCTLTLIGLLAPLARMPRTPIGLVALFAIGIVLAVGATAKIIFLPVFALVLVWLRVRDALVALGVSAMSALVILWPVRSQIPRMWDWFTATASTTARYPDEIQTQSGLLSLMSSPATIVGQYPLALIALFLAMLGCAAALRKVLPWSDLLVRVAGPGLVLAGVWAFSYKAWRPNDLMVLAPILGLLCATLVFALFAHSGKPAQGLSARIPGVLATVVLIISAAAFSIRVPGVIAESSKQTSMDTVVEFLEGEWMRGRAVASGYGVFNRITAIAFANASSNGVATAALSENYPNWFDFSIWNSMFYRPGPNGVEFIPCPELQFIVRSPQGVLLAPGRPMQLQVPNEQYEQLITTVEMRAGDLEVLRILDVTCDL